MLLLGLRPLSYLPTLVPLRPRRPFVQGFLWILFLNNIHSPKVLLRALRMSTAVHREHVRLHVSELLQPVACKAQGLCFSRYKELSWLSCSRMLYFLPTPPSVMPQPVASWPQNDCCGPRQDTCVYGLQVRMK